MLIIKKLIFALPFLLFFALFCLNLSQSLQNINAIFSFNLGELLTTTWLILYLLLALMFFMIFATLSQDWKFVLPVSVLGSLVPLLFISPPNYILIVGFLVSFLIIWFTFERKLKNYLTFKATSLIIPSIKTLATLIIFISSFVFYFFVVDDLKTNGFKIPDSIIDPVIKMTTGSLPNNNLSDSAPTQLSISQDEINLLKQNPDLLKQYGLDPKVLDQPSAINYEGISQKNLIKATVNSQIQSFINPNLGILAIILAAIFFVSLNFLSSILVLILYPLIPLIFWILEKTGFITYQTEMREVKKLIV